MEHEPSNAASTRMRADFPKLGDRQYVESKMLDVFAEGFVREDRRRLVGISTATAKEFVDVALGWFELGSVPVFRWVAVVAVRGDRLALARWSVGFGDDIPTEMLGLQQYDENVDLVERLVVFDTDNVEAAIAELDRLHGVISG
jgi:hypothetical protein